MSLKRGRGRRGENQRLPRRVESTMMQLAEVRKLLVSGVELSG